jgi:Mn2+/Fe2+ NRAMP family transporter
VATEERSREWANRARDRWRVHEARGSSRWLTLLWLLVGPGILVMLGENDAPSMLSYAATGSQYGIGFFVPFVVLTFAMAIVAQEITVRLGAVSQAGHAELIYRRFGRFWGNFAMIDLVLTNFMTLVTEFVGMVAGASFFGIPAWAAVGVGILFNVVVVLNQRYWRWERITLFLALTNLVFVPVALAVHPDWGAVGRALLTWSPMPAGGLLNQGTLTILLADIGATITPWMLFFQQGSVADKGLTPGDIRHGRLDTVLGALFATLAAMGAIVATSALYIHHMNAAQYGAAEFAQALIPYAGHFAAMLFALGIWEAGLVASMTISASSAYALGEVTGRGHSLNRSVREAPVFYAGYLGVLLLAGLLLLIPGFPLETIVILVNVVAVMTMPPAIGFLLLLVNDREVMGRWVNTPLLNVLGIGVGAFVSLAGLIYAFSIVGAAVHW